MLKIGLIVLLFMFGVFSFMVKMLGKDEVQPNQPMETDKQHLDIEEYPDFHS